MYLMFLSMCVLIAACRGAGPQQIAIEITTTPSITSTLASPTQEQASPSPTPSLTASPGPSPTSTPLPPLTAHRWLSEPIMVEAAHIHKDSLNPFGYTPIFILYGDGRLVKRVCQEGECRNLTTQLSQEALCQLTNAIDRTGFLNVDPTAFRLPEGSGDVLRLSVNIYGQNTAEIPDLDRWIENPEWYQEIAGCVRCFDPPIIDPAFINLYRLLTSYPKGDLIGLESDRLALWISEPIVNEPPRPWDERLPSLVELAERSICPDIPTQRQAIILEGTQAGDVANFISQGGTRLPIFSEGERSWQVQSRWLVHYEMPSTCQQPAGLYPPDSIDPIEWRCDPAIGAIPTPTATITPTPSNTPTPLR